jgi:hypothetical protein
MLTSAERWQAVRIWIMDTMQECRAGHEKHTTGKFGRGRWQTSLDDKPIEPNEPSELSYFTGLVVRARAYSTYPYLQ